MASSAGALDQASADYAAVLAASPNNAVVAAQALNHGVRAGDWRLALDAANALERQRALLPDARFVLLAEELRARDWAAAGAQIDAVERDRVFTLAVPVLRAWLAFASQRGDPLAALAPASAEPAQGPAAGYAAEHRAMLMLAMGRPEGAGEMLRAARSAGPRGARLKIAGASLLARRGDKAGALALLDGDGTALAAARALVEAGRPVPGAIADANAGVAELMIRLAVDLNAQDLAPVGAMFARLATRLDPGSSEAWIIAAELAARDGRPRQAVALLDNIEPGDPFALPARDQAIRLLAEGGDRDQALVQALAATRSSSAASADWVQLGEVYSRLDRQADAADAFRRAIEARGPHDDQSEWTLWLMRGGALEQAGNWPEGRAALERAYRLAPEQPYVLNYYGYAQLTRRENVDEAERLIREAHRLAPDNNAITDSLGWALYLRGRLPEAIAMLEQAAQGEPSDVEINEHLGDAYFAAGRRAEARFAWRAASVYAEGAAAARINAKIEGGLTPQLAAR